MSVSDSAVVAAFITCSNQLSDDDVDKWILVEFWAFLVNSELKTNKVQAKDVKRSIGMTDREVEATDTDGITLIEFTRRKTKKRKKSLQPNQDLNKA